MACCGRMMWKCGIMWLFVVATIITIDHIKG